MRYLLNSAVLTSFGEYRYTPLVAGSVRAWLDAGQWESTIGYAETAAALSALAGVPVPVNRRTITMHVGDEALVFRLVLPPGAPRIDPADKGRLSPEFVSKHAEIGVLRRLA